MSEATNGSVRCDWCGKLSRHPLGEYTRPGGVSVGYIRAPDWDKDGEFDICRECAVGLCPSCGSAKVVRITPANPGPDGWGGRCKACGHRWTMPEMSIPNLGPEPTDGPSQGG
jgi:hypothetical protein